jgi:cell division protein FtsB
MMRFALNTRTLYRNGVLAFILICIAVIVHEVFGQNGYISLRRQRTEVETLQQQIQQLKQENEQLEQQIKALKSDPRAIERIAREQMRMARPGETVYTLPPKEANQASPPKPKEKPPS